MATRTTPPLPPPERRSCDEPERRAQLGLLRDISSRINASFDLDRIYDVTLRAMDELFGFRHALVLLLDDGGTTLTVTAARGYPEPAVGARVPVGVGIVGIVAERRKLMRIGNLRAKRAYMDAVRRELVSQARGDALEAVPPLPGLPDAVSQIAIPLLVNDRLIGVLSVECPEQAVLGERDENLAAIVANLAAAAIHNAQIHRREEARRLSLEGTVLEQSRELERTSRELSVVRQLRAKDAPCHRLEDMLGSSRAMRQVRELLRKVAASPASTILITGENGTGKDLAAKVIHANSARAAAPFMNITCSAVPENLLESELFGHEKGAFTDARRDRPGLFELADGGTVFLDEIGEMSVALQAKLLRFLEDKSFRRVGGSREIRVDVRIVAATNRDLEGMVRAGTFREDLYYRLRVLPVELPPLRARADDVPALARHFVAQYAAEFGKDVRGLAPDAVERLAAYAWPGNVRELRNTVERAVLLADGPLLAASDFPVAPTAPPAVARNDGHGFELPEDGLDFEQLERALVRQALARAGNNKARAARLLGMPRDWLRYRMEKFGFDGGSE